MRNHIARGTCVVSCSCSRAAHPRVHSRRRRSSCQRRAPSSRRSMKWRRTTAARSCASRRAIGRGGHAHWHGALSAASNRRSDASCAGAKPDVVVVELDRSRPRISTSTKRALPIPFARTRASDRRARTTTSPTPRARRPATDGGGGPRARSPCARPRARSACALTSQYRAFGAHAGGLRPGGEFAEAIAAANELGARCVLADRDSVATIERVLELLLRSATRRRGSGRLQRLSDEELEPLKQRVLAKRAEEAAAAGDAADDEEAPRLSSRSSRR